MRKLIAISCCLFVFLSSAFSQDEKEKYQKELKDQLPSLSGVAKAAMLNKIARGYVFSSIVRSDSGIVYAKRAYLFAESIGDKGELCIAARHYAQVLLQRSLPYEGMKYYQIMIRLATELGEEHMIATGIRGIGQALWYQGDFKAAIDTIRSSINYYQRLNANVEISDAMLTISTIYGEQGNYEKAFETAQQALAVSQKFHDIANVILSFVQLGRLYRSVGDYAAALEYYKRGYSFKAPYGIWTYRSLAHNMGDLKCDMQQYDSALFYYRASFAGNAGSRMSQLRLGEYHLMVGNYDSAFFYFHMLYNLGEASGEGNIRYQAMIGLGKLHRHQKQYNKALEFGNNVWERASLKNSRLILRDACELLASIYDSLRQPQQALKYYRQYVQLRDGIITDQFKGKLFEFQRIADNEKKTNQIELLKKETQISAQNLHATRTSRNILIGAITLLSILGVIIFWNITLKRNNEKLRNESSRNEWQRVAKDLEMQALRAQMNPHFIFNCLSSINRFILKNEPDQASNYLTRFSRLIRMVLINSQKSVIPLEDEVEMLRLYLEMEQLRFKDQFDYSITYTNDIKPADIMIPPLLLQPFCENAIWHGLMHKEGKGHLSVSFFMKRDSLQCTITDDGIGREKAAEIKNRSGENRKSIGLKLTAERLALFNEDNLVQTSWNIDDVWDEDKNIAGTKVTLHIRYKEQLIEETH